MVFLPLLCLSSLVALLPRVSGVRSITGDAVGSSAVVAAGSGGGSDWCKRWLLVKFKGEPNAETEEMPPRGVFHYPVGEWNNKLLFTKSFENGCTKTYTAVCAAGTAALKVSEACPEQQEKVEKRGFDWFFTSRSSSIRRGERIQVALPSEGRTVDLTSGTVKVMPMKVGACKPVETQHGFDLMTFVSKPWFIQQQAATAYLPITWNFCVAAQYKVLKERTLWGYTIGVRNVAYEADGTLHDSGDVEPGPGSKSKGILRAYSTDKYDPAKLAVAPYFIPQFLSGDYWVIAYSEEEGYALISGGQPTIETKNGFCRTGTATNGSGLWIFTRAQQRDEALVQKVREIAKAQGFDLSVLNDVDQTNCKPFPPTVA